MTYPRWIQDLSRADFLKSVGLYVTPDHLFLVRMRKNFFRLSVLEGEARDIPLGEHSGKVSSLTGWITDEVREVALREETESRRQALTEAIRSLLPHFNAGEDPFYVCLSSDRVIVRPVYLPQVAEENLPQVLEYEMRRLLPFRLEEIYYDYLPIGKKGDKVRLLLFAVPKRIVDEILDALSAFGVKPKGVETTATALSNYLLFCAGEVTGPALVLGGENQCWEIIGLNASGNGWRQKPEILFSHWLPQTDWVQGPGREIFYSCLRESPQLFGWGAIGDFLLSVKGESLQLEDLSALGKKRLGADEGMSHPFFVPAVGAAMRGLREGTFLLNFLPGAGEEGRGQVLSWLNRYLSILFLFGLIVWGASYPIKDEIRLRQLQNEIKKIAPSVESLRREAEELRKLREEISSLSKLHDRSGEVLHVLDELSRIVPTSAYLSNLRYHESRVELRGSAENASNLVPILERSPVFKNVGFNAPSTRRRGARETFSLKAELQRPERRAHNP